MHPSDVSKYEKKKSNKKMWEKIEFCSKISIKNFTGIAQDTTKSF